MKIAYLLPASLIFLAACAPRGTPDAPLETSFPASTTLPQTLAPSNTPSPPTTIPTATSTPILPSTTPAQEAAAELDCSQVEHLDPQSPEARAIVEQFIADYLAEFPTEYMAFEEVWAVDRQDDYVLIQGSITSEERDALLIQRVEGKYRLVDQFTSTGQPLVSRYILPEVFAERNPQAPPELVGCMDVSRFVEVPAAGEFSFDPQADCSKVEAIPADSEQARVVASAIQDFYQYQENELVEIVSMQRQGDYYAVLASYRLNSSPRSLPGFFILKRSGERLESLYTIGGGAGAYTPKMFVRNLYAEVPELPPELLNCLDVSALFAGR